MNALIIGAGPAGISAALYIRRAGFDVTVVSHNVSALMKASKIENYYGFANAPTGAELYQNGLDGAKNIGVNFIEDEIIYLGMSDDFGKFVVKSAANIYEADGVILAAGGSRKTPKLRGVKEFEGKGVSYCAVCDAFFYRGKIAAVIGAGEYALHEAETLLPHAKKVMLFTDGNVLPNIPANIEVCDEKLVAVEGDNRVKAVRTVSGAIPVDGVFIAYGTAGSTELAREIGAIVVDGHIKVDANMATNVPGLYAAGDCTGGLLQVAKAVYEGAVAGLAVVKYLRGK